MPAAKNKRTLLVPLGIGLMASGFLLFFLIFFPVISDEVRYRVNPSKAKTAALAPGPESIVPADENFGIVIPKIHANAKIIPNVDPYNAKDYQLALTRGVAHAKGTVFPGRMGNSFLFSHSSVNFYEAARYNSVFYLLNKLEPGDEIDVFVNKEKFVYKVTEKKLVDATAVEYLTGKTDKKMLTLMTCWPPGTTFKRLLIIATL